MTPEEARRAFQPEDDGETGDGDTDDADEGPAAADSVPDVRPPDDAVNVHHLPAAAPPTPEDGGDEVAAAADGETDDETGDETGDDGIGDAEDEI